MRKMLGLLALFCCLLSPSIARADDAAPTGVLENGFNEAASRVVGGEIGAESQPPGSSFV